VAVTAAAVVLAWHPTRPAPPPATTVRAVRAAAPPPLSVPGRSLLPVPAPAVLARLGSEPVSATRVRVLSVPADEGFWVGSSTRERMWVQLQTRGESRVRVRPGQRLSFTGRLVRNRPGFVASLDLDAPGDAAQLDREGWHIEAPAPAIRVG
jgi:hypothetical protein